MNYQKHKKLSKLARILAEMDVEQAILDKHDPHAAEDLRWSRIYLSKAMATIDGSKALA
jgi:hypothetical protein